MSTTVHSIKFRDCLGTIPPNCRVQVRQLLKIQFFFFFFFLQTIVPKLSSYVPYNSGTISRQFSECDKIFDSWSAVLQHGNISRVFQVGDHTSLASTTTGSPFLSPTLHCYQQEAPPCALRPTETSHHLQYG